eukprot:304331-Pelagomonas_calceolata.AAC.1
MCMAFRLGCARVKCGVQNTYDRSSREGSEFKSQLQKRRLMSRRESAVPRMCCKLVEFVGQ